MKSFLGNFYRHLATFYWSHWWWWWWWGDQTLTNRGKRWPILWRPKWNFFSKNWFYNSRSGDVIFAGFRPNFQSEDFLTRECFPSAKGGGQNDNPFLLLLIPIPTAILTLDTRAMELFSLRRWTAGSAQLSNKFGMLPWMRCINFFHVINTTAYRLAWYWLHLFLLKSSTAKLLRCCSLVPCFRQ